MSGTSVREAVVLIGHGGTASDTPRGWIEELKRLEAQRRAKGEPAMSEREADLDRSVRQWPRTPQTDPYKFGLERIASALGARMEGRTLVTAYNEFCAPSVEDTVDDLVRQGYGRIVLLSTMFTPGGVHAEIEIPEIVTAARARHPGLDIVYAWPFDLDGVASFLLGQLSAVSSAPAGR